MVERVQIFKHFDVIYITSFVKVSDRYFVVFFFENILIFLIYNEKYTHIFHCLQIVVEICVNVLSLFESHI